MKNLLPALTMGALALASCKNLTTTKLDPDNGSGGMGGSGNECVPEQACPTGLLGVCAEGKLSCDANSTCVQTIEPSIERCDTSEDEDCDGKSCSGEHVWSQQFGSANIQEGRILLVDGQGNIVIAGDFIESIDFGGGPLVSAGNRDMFVAKFDSSGKLLWNRRFGDPTAQAAFAAAVDGQGNIFITGHINGSVSFGNDVLDAAATGDGDIFLAKLDPNGNPLWARHSAADGYQGVYYMTVDRDGNAVIVGETQGTFVLGGESFTSGGGADAFVAKFDQNGTYVWGKRFGEIDYDGAWGVVTDSQRSVYFTGTNCSPIDFGGGELPFAGECDGFLVKLDAAGKHVWTKSFGDTGVQQGIAVAADAQDNVVLTFQYMGTVDLGGEALSSLPMFGDTGVVKLDADGNHLWSKRLFNTGKWANFVPAVDSLGNVLIVGASNGSVDFGGGTMEAQGTDTYIAKLDANGKHVWSHRHGFTGTLNKPHSVALDALGSAWIIGFFDGTIDFGAGPLTSEGQTDTYIARFAP